MVRGAEDDPGNQQQGLDTTENVAIVLIEDVPGPDRWPHPSGAAESRAVKGRVAFYLEGSEDGMAWIKLDDGFVGHPKIQKVGPLGLALAVRGLSYCNAALTDGFIPQRQADMDAAWCGIDAQELVDAGIWDRVDGGYRIHDYLTYQPPRSHVLQERKKAQERMAFVRRSRDVRPNIDRSSPNPVPVPVPVPVPSTRSKDKDTVTRAPRGHFVPPTLEEVKAYCLERRNRVDPALWLDHYEANGWRVGRSPMKSWRAAVRTWERNANGFQVGPSPPSTGPVLSDEERVAAAVDRAKRGVPRWVK